MTQQENKFSETKVKRNKANLNLLVLLSGVIDTASYRILIV